MTEETTQQPPSGVSPLHRIRRQLWRLLSSLIPYGLGMKVLAWLWSRPLILNLVFKRRMKIVARLKNEIDTYEDVATIVRNSLLCSAFRSWAFRKFGQWPTEKIDQWIDFPGLETLRQHYDAGDGVMLVNSHYGASRFVTFYLQRLGFKVTSLESHGLLKKLNVKGADNINVLEMGFDTKFFLKHVYRGRKALLAGEILHMASDGYQGSSGNELHFHGRKRKFMQGFSELAVKVNAPVCVVFAHVEPTGRIRIEVEGPLDSGDESVPVEERTQRLLEQYISHLERRWVEDLGNVNIPHMVKYLRLPMANEETTGTTETNLSPKAVNQQA